MNKLIILGGSGIGMIAAAIAEETETYEVLGFLNDSLPLGSSVGKFQKRIPVIGTSEDVTKYIGRDGFSIFVAFVGMKREKEVFQKLESFKIPSWQLPKLIHPSAIIPSGMCHLGNGILIGPQAQLSPDVTLEDHAIMLGGSFLGHDSKLCKFAHLATNAVVGANVIVGRACHLGSNSTIREKLLSTIFHWSVRGALF